MHCHGFSKHPPDQASIKDMRSCASYDVILHSRLDWFNKGELMIEVPSQLVRAGRLANELTVEELEALDTEKRKRILDVYKPLCLSIEYEVLNPVCGFQFLGPDDHFPRRALRTFTSYSCRLIF
jgi:hypothetical protein